MTAQSVDIAHLIQVALTPIFLISAIGVTLSVLTSRLARIVDRARAMEDRLLRVVMLFVNAFLRWALAVFIAAMFIMSMLTLAAALLAFLIEVRIATTTLRIGIKVASGEGA